jgi:integrase
VFYWEDVQTKKQGSLKTRDARQAAQLLNAKNAAQEQPTLNLALAKVYATAHDPNMATRTWQQVMDELATHGKESSQQRTRRATSSKTFDLLRNKPLMETTSQDLLAVNHAGGNATKHYLRRLHNLAINLNWLAWPLLAKSAWPKIPPGSRRRAITLEEHQKILASERNPERKAFYALLWETGCSQSDGASLRAEDVNRHQGVLGYHRMKLGEDSTPAQLTIGKRLLAIFNDLPKVGYLFPSLQRLSAKERAAEFRRRRILAGVSGVSLHSYRHAWAQRAKAVGYPQRFAQAALGHKSRAVHEAYAKDAVVVCPSIEAYEERIPRNLIAMPVPEEETSNRAAS